MSCTVCYFWGRSRDVLLCVITSSSLLRSWATYVISRRDYIYVPGMEGVTGPGPDHICDYL